MKKILVFFLTAIFSFATYALEIDKLNLDKLEKGKSAVYSVISIDENGNSKEIGTFSMEKKDDDVRGTTYKLGVKMNNAPETTVVLTYQKRKGSKNLIKAVIKKDDGSEIKLDSEKELSHLKLFDQNDEIKAINSPKFVKSVSENVSINGKMYACTAKLYDSALSSSVKSGHLIMKSVTNVGEKYFYDTTKNILVKYVREDRVKKIVYNEDAPDKELGNFSKKIIKKALVYQLKSY